MNFIKLKIYLIIVIFNINKLYFYIINIFNCDIFKLSNNKAINIMNIIHKNKDNAKLEY